MFVPTTTQTRPQIFLSFGAGDSLLAAEVARTFGGAGIKVWGDPASGSSHITETRLRRELNASSAIVVVLGTIPTKRHLPSSVLFEIGAATGARKPIFTLVEDVSSPFPFRVPDMKVLPISRIDEVIDSISELQRSQG